jgi:hypothetical protein
LPPLKHAEIVEERSASMRLFFIAAVVLALTLALALVVGAEIEMTVNPAAVADCGSDNC